MHGGTSCPFIFIIDSSNGRKRLVVVRLESGVFVLGCKRFDSLGIMSSVDTEVILFVTCVLILIRSR